VKGEARFSHADIQSAMAAMTEKQVLNAKTHAVHAAGFWTHDKNLIALREDVGRHNAMDKLIGALHIDKIDPAEGMIVLTSRISVELVQKAALFGASVISAISAPTGLAIDIAEQCNITLAGIVRDDGFEIFTHPERIA
jgi:FdhD protein